MKYYYMDRGGADLVFITIADAVISATGYDLVDGEKYDFKNAQFVFWKPGDNRLGDFRKQEVKEEDFWEFLINPEWFKQKLVKTVFE
jgi:hypothetical protein